MSWFRKLMPPKIKHEGTQQKKAVPEGLWSKCPSCEAVLYFTDLENNLHVCPKCGFHNRLSARQRLDLFLDPETRAELASEGCRWIRSSSRTRGNTRSASLKPRRRRAKPMRWW
jgi:acetyl-CoA carboxylase carboxyl transferase subunit beta